jgi:hypothetical protein
MSRHFSSAKRWKGHMVTIGVNSGQMVENNFWKLCLQAHASIICATLSALFS